jgi:hypothetical protein
MQRAVAELGSCERCAKGSHSRGRRWTSGDYAACWAAGLWQRVFDAKIRSLGGDPGQILTRHEAGACLRLAGLNPGLAAEMHET